MTCNACNGIERNKRGRNPYKGPDLVMDPCNAKIKTVKKISLQAYKGGGLKPLWSGSGAESASIFIENRIEENQGG